ncbi:hypothetical protein CBR_g16167 [Chara braunii]|uniref:Uncharacterized protein n=1 Tax=Chara braunii TaxID=69332 RepID=A0A388KTW7_CHABU|nr:hypothetical protein CBR_g16167 [Chara braunii]|eukprot:GBG73452.1 hypothetical protein CBR_g16167 [Chara braunii]
MGDGGGRRVGGGRLWRRAWEMEKEEGLGVVGYGGRVWVMEEEEGLGVIGYGGRVWVMEVEEGLGVVGYRGWVWVMEEEEGLGLVGYGGRVWVMEEEEGLGVVGYDGRVWVMEEEEGLGLVDYGGRVWVMEEEKGLEAVGYGGRVWVKEEEEGLGVVGYVGRVWVMEEEEGLEVVGYGDRVWEMEEEGGLGVVGYGGRVWVMEEEEGLGVIGYSGRVWVMEEEEGFEVVGYGGWVWAMEEEEGLGWSAMVDGCRRWRRKKGWRWSAMRESKEGEGTSAAGEAGGSEDGLKRVVATLTRTLNKNQGYLADAKKKLTFDGANIAKFLIDYENLAALLKWTEEEKMEHLGQHVSLSLGRDIMAIVASSGSWKETRNEMMRKYLKAEKMATESELAAVQRKNYVTYNDFLRAFTLVALRIPGVTDRIMSKYFLRQFFEFDKDKILSAYQQTSKFEYTRDVDFSTVTDLAEKTVVTETLALLKEGEVIDLTGKTGDKVKKGIKSLHERVHGVDSKMDRTEKALLVMQAQVSRPALPPQEVVVPAAVANRGFGRRDPTNEQCKYCTMIGHFVRACPRLNHDIERQRCSRSLKGEILGPRGERVNWNLPGGMRRAVILRNNLEIAAVEAEPIPEIVWDQPRGRGPQANFILEDNGQDRVNIITRRTGAEKKLIQDTVMEELAGNSTGQQETEVGKKEKVYEKPREDETVDKATAAKKKFRYQIPIPTSSEIDCTLSKLLGTMVSLSFQTMLQASPRLLKGLRQLLTRKRVEVEEAPEPQEQDTKEVEAPQGVSNLQSIPGGLGDLEKAFADIRLSLPDHEGGEVMRAPPGTKLSFHALLTYLFERRFILRIDPTNVAGALKNYKPIDPTVGRWIGFIWRFDYKVERIAGLRNMADGLSRVCITPEGVEDAEPIDAFLEYEGGTLVVDNEMADPATTTGQLLIETLENGAPAVVAELREGIVTTVRRKEEKDSWGSEVGTREKLMATIVEGGRDAVTTLAEAWA